MRKLKIFIAGAKNLRQQRLSMKALTNDLNAIYINEGVSISMSSYENFGERQSAYDRFIENEADMVIFIIDGYVGARTEEELRLSSRLYKENGKPEIIIFMHSFTKRTDEIDYAESLINSLTEKYYVEYTNDEDLLAKAKERIDSFVGKETKSPGIRNFPKLFKSYSMALLFLALLAVGTLVYTLTSHNHILINVTEPPVSLSEAGITKDFVVQTISEIIPDIKREANEKINVMLNELTALHEQEDRSSGNIGTGLGYVKVVSSQSAVLGYIRKLLGKHDATVNIWIMDTDSSYVTNIAVDDWRDMHYTKTIKTIKNHFPNRQRCAIASIRKTAAYIAGTYSPVASVLFDYQNEEGLAEYESANPWKEDVYRNAEREKAMQNCIASSSPDSTYCYLILASNNEQEGIQRLDTTLLKKSCSYYDSFGAGNALYAQSIKERTDYLKNLCKQEEENASNSADIPEMLAATGVIPAEIECRQLIVIKDQHKITHNGKSYYKATLHAFEKNGTRWKNRIEPFKVNLGIRGIQPKELKKEGDLATPSGFYPIPYVFGYSKDIDTKMDFVVVNSNHFWVCDTASEQYNKMIEDVNGIYKSNPKNERLRRQDQLYKYAIVIDFNQNPTIKGKGSAIYMHVERATNHRTAGCISFSEKKIKALIQWLDPEMTPHIYISEK